MFAAIETIKQNCRRCYTRTILPLSRQSGSWTAGFGGTALRTLGFRYVVEGRGRRSAQRHMKIVAHDPDGSWIATACPASSNASGNTIRHCFPSGSNRFTHDRGSTRTPRTAWRRSELRLHRTLHREESRGSRPVTAACCRRGADVCRTEACVCTTWHRS